MFDGRFDPCFYQAFTTRDPDADTQDANFWLAAPWIGGLGLMAAVCLALLR